MKKGHFFPKKLQHHQKMFITLNLYIGTNVLVYERWLVLNVLYTAGPMFLQLHRLALLMHASQKIKCVIMKILLQLMTMMEEMLKMVIRGSSRNRDPTSLVTYNSMYFSGYFQIKAMKSKVNLASNQCLC